MAKLIIPDTGQTIEIDDDIAATDATLLEALLPIYPAAGNAVINRREQDGEKIVEVVKRAGSKG